MLGRQAQAALVDIDSQSSSFISVPAAVGTKSDDLLYHATVRNLREDIRTAGLRAKREDLTISRMVTRSARLLIATLIPSVPSVRDILVTNMEYVLVRDDEAS